MDADKINREKIDLRIQNESYIRNHSEIKDILHYFMNTILLAHPEDVIKSSVGKLSVFDSIEILGDPNLKQKVESHKQAMQSLGSLD